MGFDGKKVKSKLFICNSCGYTMVVVVDWRGERCPNCDSMDTIVKENKNRSKNPASCIPVDKKIRTREELMDLKKVYHDQDGKVRNIRQTVILEPEWASNRIQEGEKAIDRVKLLEKAICVYSRECIDIDFDNDKDALDSFELWAEDE